jgi:polyisoprenyl-phosphate glycosyltransferase
MDGLPTVSIVVSFYNEEPVLDALVRRLDDAFVSLQDEARPEYVFVDDRSTDRSREILLGLRATRPHLKVITTSRNYGLFPGIMAGLDHATGDAVITMDADLQDPPELVPELVRAWKREEADVVYTVRTARKGESPAKMAATRMGYELLRSISTVDLPIESGDFRLMSRKVVDLVRRLPEAEPFIRGLVRWVGFKQVPVQYERQARLAGDTHFIFYKTKVLKNFLSGIISFSDAPAYFPLLAGLALAAVTAIALPLAAFAALFGSPGPWLAVVVLLVASSAVQLVSIGLVGIYVAKILQNVRGRPRYVVDRSVGFGDDG